MELETGTFNKDANILNRRMDHMTGLRPLELVRALALPRNAGQ